MGRTNHERWMKCAIELANAAGRMNEVPVGAVVVLENEIIGQGHNRSIDARDPSAHAEIVALRAAAAKLKNYRLPGASLYVTIEPCAMCAGAMIQARIKRVVFGARDPKSGAAGSVFNVLDEDVLNHKCEVISGVLEIECSQLLQAFFQARR